MSFHTDRGRVVGIYKAPAHLSRDEFESKCQAWVDALLALPIAKNLIKFEMSFATDTFEESIQALNVGTHQSMVVLIVEARSDEQVEEASRSFPSQFEMLTGIRDPGLEKVMKEWMETLGLADSWSFHAKVITKLEKFD
ncbi:hypothetical protein B0H11DRAFT_1904066 [Mycena galericulata]|nr:hypothetical protein B0H11DRAFT_2222441 [Mycena galericulata]KAJ7506168.1 hypothetical protein B0H11DRAFT_1904066 [Mycena galericulata]